VPRNLRARLLDADPVAEIDFELERRLLCFGIRLGGDDSADTDIDSQELIEGDRRRRGGIRIVFPLFRLATELARQELRFTISK
jgi:hypothetical protein